MLVAKQDVHDSDHKAISDKPQLGGDILLEISEARL